MKSYWLTKEAAISIGIDWQKYDAKLEPSDIQAIQEIDADCNDCKHFQRGKCITTISGLTSEHIPLGKAGTYFEGHCRKFDKPTKAFPVHYSGHPCFEHRKA